MTADSNPVYFTGYGGDFEDNLKEEPIKEECGLDVGDTPGIMVSSYFEDADVTLDGSPWVKEEISWAEDPTYEEVDIEYGNSKASLALQSDIKEEQVQEESSTSRRNFRTTNGSNQVIDLNKANTRARKMHTCSMCDFECRTAYCMCLHLEKHSMQESRKQQSMKTIEKTAIKRHHGSKPAYIPHSQYHQEAGENSPFVCYHCKYKCYSEYHLSEHVKTHKRSKPFRCDYCDFGCRTEGYMTVHMKTHQRICDFCDYTCQKPDEMKTHMKTHLKQFICDLCDAKFKQAINLKRHHKLSHHGVSSGHLEEQKLVQTEANPYACAVCEFTCKLRRDLRKHVSAHHVDKLYDCPFCGFRSATHRSLKIHLGMHAATLSYSCEVCAQECSTPSRLDKHMMTHCDVVCEFCKYRTNSVQRMNLHLVSHRGGYGCDVCGEKFTSVRKLYIHKKEHSEVNNLEPLACKFCDYRCSEVDILIAHSKTHTGESSR